MSTNRSVGRLAAAQGKVRTTATREKNRLGVPTQETSRSAASRKKDRSTNLRAFTFADGAGGLGAGFAPGSF